MSSVMWNFAALPNFFAKSSLIVALYRSIIFFIAQICRDICTRQRNMRLHSFRNYGFLSIAYQQFVHTDYHPIIYELMAP